ncbi:MAG: hypothetical protein JWM85_783, partial [Acidimicrobiaceae bacterium]|nr:hypothetical protein [Acidimicrobiaceae bacterium]
GTPVLDAGNPDTDAGGELTDAGPPDTTGASPDAGQHIALPTPGCGCGPTDGPITAGTWMLAMMGLIRRRAGRAALRA